MIVKRLDTQVLTEGGVLFCAKKAQNPMLPNIY